MGAIMITKKNYIITKCTNCGKEILRYKYKKGDSFCANPSYCRYEFMHKKRDPIGSNILNNKNLNFYYLIGLICADGNISYPQIGDSRHKGYSCYININKKDEDLIFQIKKLFGGQYQYIKKDNTIRWNIQNKKFINYLKEIGLTNNKSSNLNIKKWFNKLNFKQKNAFIRGLVDGDGSIKIYKQKNRVFNICIGSPKLYDVVKTYFLSIQPERIVESHLPTYSYIGYTSINMIDVLDKIYNVQKNHLFLKRKYNTYIQIKKFYKSYNRKKDKKYQTPDTPPEQVLQILNTIQTNYARTK
jgi:hypothetical protein